MSAPEDSKTPSKESAVKVSNEIPDALKENPPPEQLSSLDRALNAVLDDIKVIIDGRNKEFQVSEKNKTRLPIIPDQFHFTTYKTDRQKLMEGINQIDNPTRRKSYSEAAIKEIQQDWNVEELFDGGKLGEMVMQFFGERRHWLLLENSLLISRWNRFCRTSYDATKYISFFKKRQTELKNEYKDTAHRYERLYECNANVNQKNIERMEAEESKRIRDERNGLAVLKETAQGPWKDQDESQKNAKSSLMSAFGEMELPADCCFNVADLTIYLRHIISAQREKQDMNTYLLKAKNALYSDTAEFLRDYGTVSSCKAGQDITENLQFFEGINGFIPTIPNIPPRLEDFFVDFEALLQHWQIETLIGQEDGRPFAYEVDHKFMDAIYDQCTELTFIPYDNIAPDEVTSDNPTSGNGIGGYAGSLGLDSTIITLASISGASSKTISRSKMTKLRTADWLHLQKTTIAPNFADAKYCDFLASLLDIDMELKLEYDVLLLADNDMILNHLKVTSQRIWEKAASVPNCRPVNTKVSIIPQSRDHKKEGEPQEIRHPKLFDLSLKIPTGNYENQVGHILAEKKLAYASILKANEDTRKVELEIANADSSKIFDESNYIVPTVASIFAEHEVLTFFQLRFVKIRDARIKLLRQLNFFRSVEKRLAIDVAQLSKNGANVDPLATAIADMWISQEFFDPSSKKDGSKSDRAASASEDIRTTLNDRIYTSDHKGIPFLYDVSLKDLEDFENEMLKVLTVFINTKSKDNHVDPEYLDDLKFRTSNKKADMPNATFRNPAADRAQMLLEYYEGYLEYNYSKIQLLNGYLEAFEHVVHSAKVNELAQLITELIHSKPAINFEEEYFSKSLVHSKSSLDLHARIVESYVTSAIASRRDWIDRFHPRSAKDAERKEAKGKDKDSKPPLYNSTLRFGLPEKTFCDEIPTIIMHHPAIVVGMTEMVPELENVTEIWGVLKTTLKEAEILLAGISKLSFNSTAAECSILKLLNRYWDALADTQFRPPLNKRGTILESDVYLTQNPYVPDSVLKEVYVPFDQTAEGNFKSLEINLEPRNVFNDPSFTVEGNEILYRLLKAIVLDYRINNSWHDGENWRKIFEGQLHHGQIKKSNITSRFPSLKFDSPGEAPTESVVEEDREEDGDVDLNETNADLDEDRNWSAVKYGPLAIAELDDTILYSEEVGIEGILSMLKKDGISRLKKILKLQLLDKHWFASAAEITKVLFVEVYRRNFCLGPKAEDSPEQNDERRSSAADLQGLIPSILNQKKMLRKVLANEFSKEYRTISLEDISDLERESRLKRQKNLLFEFYFNNMFQIVSQEIERAEFVKFMFDFRIMLNQTTFAPLLFFLSPITKYSEFLAGTGNGETPKSVLKQPAATQGLIINSTSGMPEKLAHMWYIPHVTEIIIGMARPDKPFKGTIDYNGLIYKNHQTYSRSFKVHCLIEEIFTLISGVSSMLQGNQRYSAAVANVREADYIVNSMNSIKRDFQAQGENAEYNRVLKGLSLRWQFWSLKWKYIMSVCIDCLQYNLLSTDAVRLTAQLTKSTGAKNRKRLDAANASKFMKPLKTKNRRFGDQIELQGINQLFPSLSAAAKNYCHYRVSEIEEDLEEESSTMQAESRDEVKQKVKIDSVASGLKTLRLKKEYMKTLSSNDMPFTDEATRASYFTKFKLRIIVPAIQLYHKSGSKGGHSTDYLLKDFNVLGMVDSDYRPMFVQPDFTRIGKNSFEKCKQFVLQNEIMRHFTQKRLVAARDYFDRLTDERIGRLFRSSDNIEISSVTGQPDLAFKVSNQDYSIKSEVFNQFLDELYQASTEYINDTKNQAKPKGPLPSASLNVANQPPKPDESVAMILDDKRVFACKKNDLGRALSNFAIRCNKWHSDRVVEQEQFYAALYAHLIDMFKAGEKIIVHQNQEKRELVKCMDRNARFYANELAFDAYTAMSTMEVELAEARKNKKVDEKRIRSRILEEYDSLVDELVREISILRNRFREYQVSNFNEIVNIILESKTEHLLVMEKNENLTLSMRNAITTILKHDAEIKRYQEQNFELKMTILKIRSMFTMKEQGAKSFFQSKLRTLTALHKETEAKLWDSFREGEARERALRKQLSRLLKAKSSVDIQNELLQSQLRAEQDKSHQSHEPNHPAKSRKGHSEGSRGKKHLTELESRLKRYEEINIENLIQELTNKTALAEELLQEKRERDKMLSRAPGLTRGGPSSSSRATSAFSRGNSAFSKDSSGRGSQLLKPDSGMKMERTTSAATARTAHSPAPFGLSSTAAAAEPLFIPPEHRMIGQERIDELEKENKALRRKLFLNGINLPPESKKAISRLSHDPTRLPQDSASRGVTPNLSRPRTANGESDTASRPITAQSASQTGILKNPLGLDNSETRLPGIPLTKSFKGVFFDV
ncbi:hypothetical protein HDV03_002690 [Kappamyces sp. JEL0829]|nr:hypothetical protein HDV03_002690 [Kappamyces sp. JEL0829]